MAISNTSVVNSISKYIVKSKGIGNEIDQEMITGSAEKLAGGNDKSLVSLIECYFLIEGTGTLTLSTSSEENDLILTGKGKYGLRPDQLKFGNDKQVLLTTDSNVISYLLVTEFRRTA
jgi:hypothetical protein